MTAAAAADHGILQPLRQDLAITEAAPGVSGERRFLMFDHIRNRCFRLPWRVIAILSAWGRGDTDAAAREASVILGTPVSAEEVQLVGRFAADNQLTEGSQPGAWRIYERFAAAGDKSALSAAAHAYIYFRVPLFRPQRLLDAAWPVVAPLFTRTFGSFAAIAGVIGLLLAFRHWDSFLHTFQDFMSLDGFLTYATCLAAIKMLHELGHAFMARKYNVRVPVIGAAFIVLFPILYTDTTAAWRLSNRRRLMIDAAGIFTELVIAVVATWAWLILPDGAARGIAFATATVGWTMSLAVNLNPLMRFDGYYLLADFLGMENLQERSFARARWQMRELLFGLGDPAPEPMPRRFGSGLVLLAWATWVYRFFLFLGIALLVYHFAVKLVGLALFALEIGVFILRPAWGELRQWWQRRGDFSLNPATLRTTALLLATLFLALYPWRSTVTVPALLGPVQVTPLHAPAPARIEQVFVVQGAFVRKGDVLFRLSSPDLDIQLAEIDAEARKTATGLKRIAADKADRSRRAVLVEEADAAATRRAAVVSLRAALTIVAPHDGTVSNLPAGLKHGVWVSVERRLAAIADNSAQVAHGYVEEEAAARIAAGAGGRFIPNDASLPTAKVVLSALTPVNASRAVLPELTTVEGGPIPVREAPDGDPVPVGSWYPALLAPESPVAIPRDRAIPGIVRLEAEPRSVAGAIARRFAAVLLRESGF